MEKLIGEYSYIEIPEDAPKDNPVFIHLNKIWTDSRYLKTWWRKLPPGNYELIGISSEITEEQAQGIVEEIFSFGRVRRWKDYQYPDSGLYSALDSFKILLASKGLKGRYAILKTIKKWKQFG